MIFWQILVYLSIAVCFFGAAAVLYGWIKFGIQRKEEKNRSAENE